MEMDLNARSAKWKREQDKQKERARRQRATEALKRAAAERARLEMESAQAQKRAERIQEQERAEQQALDEARATGGIRYVQQLRPVPTATDGDKITLPVSALEELNPQNAFDLGVFTFELSYQNTVRGRENDTTVAATTRITHAGVLEFVADEGTVGLPPKVAASLFATGKTTVPESIQVRFVRLEKGKFASLQPKGDGFGEREIDFKAILERSLKAHTTLTVGDTLFVRHGRQTFEVAVAELQPEEAVNILNTDLEVAVLPSEAATLAKQAEQKKLEAQALADAQAQEKERLKAERMRNLTVEPPADERLQTKIMLRLPDGSQTTRRVAHSSLLHVVFELVEALTGEQAEQYQLVATYPRRVFGADSSGKSLRDLNLNGRQEALFVEKVSVPSSEEDATQQSLRAGEVDLASSSPQSVLSDTRREWKDAMQLLEARIDEALNTNTATPIHALEPIIPMDPSADQATKWAAQLNELDAMGFTNRAVNVEVLERYQGRLLRVVNYLSELTSHSEPVASSASAMEE